MKRTRWVLWVGVVAVACGGASEPPVPALPAPAPGPNHDIGGGPVAAPDDGTAPLTVAVPADLFTEAQVRCAGGLVTDVVPETAGTKAVVLAPGLPMGESCVLLLKGRLVSRHGPVTAGQRWTCRFRRAEALCKLLGGPLEPTLPTPDDWVWDKVEATPTTKAEARALDAATPEAAPAAP